MNGNDAQLSLWQILDSEPATNITEPEYAPGATIDERFAAFHAANPQVYNRLRSLALELKRRGIRHYGIAALFELLRFDEALQTAAGTGEPFKLNNNYRALYARLLMQREPRLAGFFETRKRTAA